MTEPGRYLFAVARGLDPDRPGRRRTGFAARRCEVVERRDLAGRRLRGGPGRVRRGGRCARNLEDLGWLEEVARTPRRRRAARVAAPGAVAPMRLVTICPDDDSVAAAARGAGTTALHEALDRVEGRQRVEREGLRARRQPSPSRPAAGAGATSGRRLPAAQARAGRRSGVRPRSSRLRSPRRSTPRWPARSVAAGVLPPQDPRLTGRRGDDDPQRRLPRAVSTSRGRFRAPVGRLAELHPDARASSSQGPGRRTPSRRWTDAVTSSPSREVAPVATEPRRSRWSTCWTGCSAPASCWPATW